MLLSTPPETSPVSDTKMDISESATTISQDSPVTSPDVRDSLASNNKKVTDITGLSSPITCTKTSSITANKNPNDTIDSDNNDEEIVLDNRINISDDSESLVNRHENSTVMSRSGFTLANSHPLMSPLPPEDSPDSIGQNNFNYPDVVPDYEPLRLANPNPVCNPTTSDLRPSPNQSHMRPNLPLDVLPDNTHNDNYSDKEFNSDESEPDVSQYQASVEPTFQSVSLVANSSSSKLQTSPKTNKRRKIPVSSELLSGDDVSSVETFSNNSLDNAPFDDDFFCNDGFNNEPNINSSNLVSASVSSSMLDDGGMSTTVSMTKVNAMGDKDDEQRLESAMSPGSANLEPLPQYTAIDEIRDSRNWQKVTLPNGKIRDIDMKVIEPYKRVLSHGGYLKAGGHNAIVVFSACYLPDRSRTDYHYVMDNLFL